MSDTSRAQFCGAASLRTRKCNGHFTGFRLVEFSRCSLMTHLAWPERRRTRTEDGGDGRSGRVYRTDLSGARLHCGYKQHDRRSSTRTQRVLATLGHFKRFLALLTIASV